MTIRSLISTEALYERLVSASYISKSAANSAAVRQSVTKGSKPYVCDATCSLPGADEPESTFLSAHIPGAVFFDLDECADVDSGLTRTIPSASVFEEYVNHLGIGANTEVVAYDHHQGFGGLFSAPRLWWLFRVFGHPFVRVLNGGFDKWVREDRPLSSLPELPAASPPQAPFRAKYDGRYHRTLDQVREGIERGKLNVLDARPEGAFSAGHVPSSKNLFFRRFLSRDTGEMKSPKELDQLFLDAGIDLSADEPFVASCLTGTTACSMGLAAQVVAEEKGLLAAYAVYDGSMQEWMAKGEYVEVGDPRHEQ